MGSLAYNTDAFCSAFPPVLRTNFKELFTAGISLTPFTTSDISCDEQYSDFTSKMLYSYLYRLKIPYAGRRLSWDLLFDPDDMEFAPDFNFHDSSLFAAEDVDSLTIAVPSLVKWNVKNAESLKGVLCDFLKLYKKQHLEKMGKDNIYSFINKEYQRLIEQKTISSEDIELFLDSSSAHFLINIKIDLPSLLSAVPELKDGRVWLNPGEVSCALKLVFLKLDGSRVNTSLQLSPALQQVVKNNALKLPSYTQISLVKYVATVTKQLQDAVKEVEQHQLLKKEYIHSLATKFSHSLIEYDSQYFTKGTFLCNIDDYYCVVQVVISNAFPEIKPTITLQSLYCISCRKSCEYHVKDYRYSPRWKPGVMVHKLREQLPELIETFKTHKH